MDEDRSWVPIRTETDGDRFEQLTSGLHDGLIKEVRWWNSDYIDDQRWLLYSINRPAAQMLIQTQQKGLPALLLSFYGVEELLLESKSELQASVHVANARITIWLSAAGSSRVVAAACWYQILDETALRSGPFDDLWLFATEEYDPVNSDDGEASAGNTI
jgi:hypothetical protein